jgi:hypothetical protein
MPGWSAACRLLEPTMADAPAPAGCPPERLYRIAGRLGVDPGCIRGVAVLSERHGHCLWRVVTEGRSYVLKRFPPGDPGASEVAAYRLLQELRVPTLPVYGLAQDALLLEDLAASAGWRLAREEDVLDPAVGRAVARWYRVFHRQGARLLARPGGPPAFLTREIDCLDPASLRAAGRRLGLEAQPGWRLAGEHVEDLKAAMRALPETLNYNDFYWTNLALSRAPGAGLRVQAIVFDYHLLGIGPRYCDCRNVAGSLAGAAVAAFWQEYGPVDPWEEVLDRPMSTLVGLVTAAQRDRFPRWAQASLDRVLDGGLERDLRAALDPVQGRGS